MNSQIEEGKSAEWTNEKHRLYLESIETSFVNRLYNSSDLLSWRQQKGNLSNIKSSRQACCNPRVPSGQFKVLRRGCWQKVNFERPGVQLNKEDESLGFLASPWIRHFSPVYKPQVLAPASLQGSSALKSQAIASTARKDVPYNPESATGSRQFHVYRSPLQDQDFIDSTEAEVSDQNFVDEEIRGENASGICSSEKDKNVDN
ncbi:uncharacterized protein LOC110815231 isoform X1 [Carica papaya]|uniref:uncharacterized protein LOC110815231 isoform X1 n=1 Tax=Carica papaya TaxID=3649 RepID=UPI000B8D0710|nr:uncharacterized protein LOC110815231 isoform X1 [Carica papaya]XP_021898602.1 uncharacterized protein LOC110815231 isoform X1 [Carica papaya]